MRRLLVLMTAVWVTACSPGDPMPIGCSSDQQCGEGEVCFAGGCGNPGENIVLEVRPNPQAGLHAQDFEVQSLSGQQNVELADPSAFQGRVSQEGDSGSSAYSGAVTFRVTGESLLIPGVERRYTSTLTPENGLYQVPVGTGRYTITLTPASVDLPPVQHHQEVESGQTVGLDFLLPSSTAVTRLSGKVVHLGQPLVEADLEVQAFDAILRPLSHRVPVQKSTGMFTLALPPSAAKTNNVLIQVTPAANPTTNTVALVPQKIFSVNPSQPLPLSLELGDYGAPVTVKGRLVDQEGLPIADASVSVQGNTEGNGLFRSQKAVTDAQGYFTLLSLPSMPDQPHKLHAAPPPRSRAGLTVQYVPILRTGTPLVEVVCPDRRIVRGSLLLPDSDAAAAGVRVQVETVGEVPGWPRPTVSNDPVRLTDSQGRFELALDPGQYRLDFIPLENLPRVSRLIVVRPSDSPSAPAEPLELPAFSLNKASRVRGVVTFGGERFNGMAAGRASIRFFRVVNVEGRPTSVLLAESLTDDAGNYTATLPTR